MLEGVTGAYKEEGGVSEGEVVSPVPTAVHQKMGELDIHAVSSWDKLAKATETHTRKNIASLHH